MSSVGSSSTSPGWSIRTFVSIWRTMISMCLSLIVTPWLPVDLLDLLDQVALDGVLAPGVEVLLRVDRAVGDRVAGADLLAVLDEQLRVVRDRVLALDDVLGADDDAVPLGLARKPCDRRRGRRRCCGSEPGERPG